jgi:DNA-binding response OmpR family regulator
MQRGTPLHGIVLFVGSDAREHASLRHIFDDSPWEFQGTFTVGEGLDLLRHTHHRIGVVICDRCLPDGDWKIVLTELDGTPDRPTLIVSSRLADERLWAEVLNLGAFDLLQASPFMAEEVLWVTQCASAPGAGVGDLSSAVQFSSESSDEPRRTPALTRIATGNA